MSKQASTKRFSRIHAVCTYRCGKPCDRCPAKESSPYGQMVRGCRAMAEELFNIAVHGNPWGKRAKKKVVRAWRKRFNRG